MTDNRWQALSDDELRQVRAGLLYLEQYEAVDTSDLCAAIEAEQADRVKHPLPRRAKIYGTCVDEDSDEGGFYVIVDLEQR